MERWQSTFENRVKYNLSESGVHPMTVRELEALAGNSIDIEDVRLVYGQSNGSDLLRKRIAALYKKATAQQVLVTVGGIEANFTAFWHLMNPGEKAAVFVPNYMQVPGLLESFGAIPIPVPLVESEGWQPDLDALAGAIDAGCRFILVTNPNNPTGAALTRESMEGIVAQADRASAWILADEVYCGAELGDDETPSFWGMYDKVIVTNSMSKAYGLPGLRIGWLVAPANLAEDLWSRTDYTTIAPATLSDSLACLALEKGTRARIRARTKRILNENVDIMSAWMEEQEGLFRYQLPDAGAFVYTHYDADIGSGEFAELLRTHHDVLVVPGSQLGMDNYLRIGFGNPAAELKEGLAQITEAFEGVRG